MTNSKYITTNKTIKYLDIKEKGFAFSANKFKFLNISNKNNTQLKGFLDRDLNNETDLGEEVGSINYIYESPNEFLRTKALFDEDFLPKLYSQSSIPIKPSIFKDMKLKRDDLIISKDGNIGSSAILDQDYPKHMLSGAIYRLPVSNNKLYLFAFLKHPMFREQLDYIVPKGASLRHAKQDFLKCVIPLPKKNKEKTIHYIETLVRAIINKEKSINKKHKEILFKIDEEIRTNQKGNVFEYKHPSINELSKHSRLDSGFSGIGYKALHFPITNYANGFKKLTSQGLEMIPGPSLELKIIEKRVDSNYYIEGYYRLITPKIIKNQGVTTRDMFIGTPKEIPTLKYGDILFGESGTGRTMVFLDNDNFTINNAHAHILRPKECTLAKAIFIRCVMQYYKEIGLIDHLTVGGSGGHLSPSYFDRIFIPEFKDAKINEISNLYSQPNVLLNKDNSKFEDFLDLDNYYNDLSGVYELDKSCKYFKKILNSALDKIIDGKEMKLSFPDYFA